MIEVRQLSKHFSDPKKGKIVALDQVDFVAEPGQAHGLLGVNGAGKTTLLRILSTVIRATSGSARVQGHDVLENGPDVRRSIGFLSTTTGLYGRLSGREMLTYFGTLYGFSGQELAARVEAALDRVEAQPFAHQLCDRLSTGQKQRISIARSTLHDPPVLLFDEPTAGLDILAAQTVLGFIETAKQQGKTVVFSTHVMSEVERLCDTVTVIHQGKVCGRDTVENLKASTNSATMEQAFLKTVGHMSEGAA